MNYINNVKRQIFKFICIAFAYNLPKLFLLYFGWSKSQAALLPWQFIISFSLVYIFVYPYIDQKIIEKPDITK
jgi:hypothetical protein